jgi:hypothetical protein
MQTFIETGDKLNNIQVRFDELPKIFNKSESAQNELELSDDTDHSVDRQQFEDQYFEVKAKFNELLHPVVDPPRSRHSSPRIAACQDTPTLLHAHTLAAGVTLNCLLLPCPHLKVTHAIGYISETHLRL